MGPTQLGFWEAVTLPIIFYLTWQVIAIVTVSVIITMVVVQIIQILSCRGCGGYISVKFNTTFVPHISHLSSTR